MAEFQGRAHNQYGYFPREVQVQRHGTTWTKFDPVSSHLAQKPQGKQIPMTVCLTEHNVQEDHTTAARNRRQRPSDVKGLALARVPVPRQLWFSSGRVKAPTNVRVPYPAPDHRSKTDNPNRNRNRQPKSKHEYRTRRPKTETP